MTSTCRAAIAFTKSVSVAFEIQLAGFVSSASLGSQYPRSVTSSTSYSFALTSVPEPSALVLGLAGVLVGLRRAARPALP